MTIFEGVPGDPDAPDSAGRGSAADELGCTQTEAGARTVADGVSGNLGRYRIERELGAGGMGVVHVAFDSDLERRVALKVLKVSAPSAEAKDRLMREARAMARLSHPNVVAVHEVGTANGRDFVAMELIQGETLADWMRAKRASVDLVDAFLAAGRGLAAAHAAGLVHRDFKPHNVLRGRDGRIVVTDFGLARTAESDDEWLRRRSDGKRDDLLDVPAAGTPPSALTATGAWLGTPAYMAPEQWHGGAMTPATDQFAYCVALWEALAGERPYPGPSREALRAQVERGPGALDASKVPRRLREVLRRGLAPSPRDRWPSMDALLARVKRGERRWGVAAAIMGAAVALALVLGAVMPGHDANACGDPARPPAEVWSPWQALVLRATDRAAHAEVLDAAMHDWRSVREAACRAPIAVRQAQLQCLDGVLARIDIAQRALTTPPTSEETLAGTLVDPQLCARPAVTELPRLALAPTRDVVAAYALFGRSRAPDRPSDDELAALVARNDGEPCARVIAMLALDNASEDRVRMRPLMTEAASIVDQCGDDRLRAELLLRAAPYQWELPVVGPKGMAAMRLAQSTLARVQQPDLSGVFDELQMFIAIQAQQVDEAMRLADRAMAHFGERGLRLRQAHIAMARNELRLIRAEPSDLEAIARDVAAWRPIAVARRATTLIYNFDQQAAHARYRLGDLAGGRAALLALWRTAKPHTPLADGRPIAGRVVDGAGRPVAGATVAVGANVASDSIGIGNPLADYDDSLRLVTTDADGRFAIPDAAPRGAIIAQLGAQRSEPMAVADRLRLVLHPTRTVHGRVELGGIAHTRARVTCEPIADPTGMYRLTAPVAADGSFAFEGAPRGALQLAVQLGEMSSARVEYRRFPASADALTDITLAPSASERALDIIVRSELATALDGAQVILIAGRHPLRTVDELLRLRMKSFQTAFAHPVLGENIPASLRPRVRPGDLVARIEHVEPGELTACALSFASDLFDQAARKRLQSRIGQLAMRCATIDASTAVVELVAPAQPRLD